MYLSYILSFVVNNVKTDPILYQLTLRAHCLDKISTLMFIKGFISTMMHGMPLGCTYICCMGMYSYFPSLTQDNVHNKVSNTSICKTRILNLMEPI